MCVYEECPYLCMSKKEHHSRYAKMRREKIAEFIKTPSPKVNWDIVEQLKSDFKSLRKKEKSDDEL